MIQIIALLYASHANIQGLRAFESQVLPILKEHGGVLVSASSNMDRLDGEPDEIHVIQFPSKTEFDAYKNDPRVLALRDLKDSVIKRMETHITNQFFDYDLV